ncbi:MAG: hypothetical protein JXA22_10520 [Candidatus Thermoplasmatota archaeon]|nr:hypothetical protein [Candidatus Thermoplasmatota archaeon]
MNSEVLLLAVLLALLSSSTAIASGQTNGIESAVRSELSPSRTSFAGGNGTIDDPYQISTISELQNISSNLTEHFMLINDIDASETRNWNGGKGFLPMGNSDFSFKGSLDGKGFNINALWIDRTGYGDVGLFAVMNGAWVHHIDIGATGITGQQNVGVLCGRAYDPRIENCTVSGKVTGTYYNIAGLTGYAKGQGNAISNCTSDVDLTLNGPGNMFQIGGLIGHMETLKVDNCRSTGDLVFAGSGSSDMYYLGGMIGHSTGTVRNSRSSGSMEAKGWDYIQQVAGLIGRNEGEVENCSSESNIEIEGISSISCNYIGGLIGYNPGSVIKGYWTGFVNVYYSSTSVITVTNLGGLTGYNTGQLSLCHSGGMILISGNSQYIGGLSGYSSGQVSGSYSTVSISISAQTYAGQIAGLIGAFSSVPLSGSYSTGPVDVSVSSGNCDYIGGLIGEFYRGQMTECYSKSDISVIVTGYLHNTGGLIGYCNQGVVDRTYATGSIEISLLGQLTQLVGGLIGQNNLGTLSNSYSTGSISIDGSGNVYNIGGLVGHNNKKISYGYSTVTIDISVSPTSADGVHSVGGLIGYNYNSEVEWAFSEGDITCDLTGSLANNRFYRIGGFIGENLGGFISKVYSGSNISRDAGTGNNVKYQPERVGGLIGYNSGTVLYTYSNSIVSINESQDAGDIGGLVGYNDGSVSESYAIGSIFYTQAPGHNDMGGLVGQNYGEGVASISDSYAVTSVSSVVSTEIGGIVGNNMGSISDCFYDKDVFPYDRGVVRGTFSGYSANTTIEMKKERTFLNEEWDFVNSWGMIEDRTYPWLYQLYHPPVIILEKTDHALEDQKYIIRYKIEYSSYPSINSILDLEFDNKSVPWISHDPVSRTLSGTPGNDDVGFYFLNLSVEDLVGEVGEVNFDLEVVNVNDPPQITIKDITSIMEDEPYSVYYFANDIDPHLTELTWRMETDAKWLEFKGNHLHGLPLNYHIGQYWVNVSVYDEEMDFSFTNFTLTVESANDAPIITIEPVTIAFEDKPYVLDLTAKDEDLNDIMTWTLESAPSWILFTRYQIKGTPTNDDVGLSWVRLKVTDLEGASDEIGFILEVKNMNDIPYFLEFPDEQNITQGDMVSLNVLAEDPDLGDIVYYNITSDPASNITIHSRAGTILWYNASLGNYTVNISANDGSVWIHREFVIIVNERLPIIVPENHPPVISEVADMEIEIGKTLSVQVVVSDEDGDILLFEIAKGPGGMMISSSGLILWTPGESDIGDHVVNISVTDGREASHINFNVKIISGSEDDDTKDEKSTTGYVAVIIILAILVAIMVVLLLILLRKGHPAANGEPPTDEEGEDGSAEGEEE